MKIISKAKSLELTPELESFVEEKFETLKKFVNILKRKEEGKTLAEVFVELEKETKHHRKGDIFSVKALVILPGKKLMAKATSDDLLKAVVEAKERLKMEIEKYKLKIIEKRRRSKEAVKIESF